MSSQRHTGVDTCLSVCVGRGGGGEGGCLASGSRPLCIFVSVICVTARRFSLPLRTKIKP